MQPVSRPKRFKDGRRRKDGHRQSFDELPPSLRSEAEAAVTRFIELAESSKHQFEMGDLVLRLRDVFGLSLNAIRSRLEVFGFGRSTLGQYAQVAEAFPTLPSRASLSWFACFEAFRTWKRSSLDFKKRYSPESIARKALKMRKTARSIRKHYNAEEKRTANETNKLFVQQQRLMHPALDAKVIHARCEDIIPTLPDNSVKMFFADPPYSNYCRDESGVLNLIGSYSDAVRSDCDNLSRREAEELCCRVFELALPKLVRGGCLIVWQAGGKPVSWHILKAAEEAGWYCPYEGLWDKKIPVPGHFSKPLSISSEKFLVFYRADDPIEDHTPGGEYRRDILDPERLIEFIGRHDRSVAPTERLQRMYELLGRQEMLRLEAKPSTRSFCTALKRGQAHVGDAHVFQKPDELNRFFLTKFTHEGDLVVDLMGCSGGFCAAAAALKRRWIYIESNEINFNWAVTRLATFLPNARGAEVA